MQKDIVERLQMVADIEDASSIPPEFLDNAFFRQIMKDAIAEINKLRRAYYNPATDCYMYTGTPVTTGIGTQTTANTPLPYTTYPAPTTAAPTSLGGLYGLQPVPTTLGGWNQIPGSFAGWQQIPVSQTMIYSEMDKKILADKAVAEAVDTAVLNGEPPPTVEEKDRLWDLIKSSVEGGG